MENNICEEIIEEIKNLPTGTVFTIKEFLDKHNIDKSVYLSLSVKIIGSIREFARIHEDDKGRFSGLPFVYRYIKK